MATKKSGKKTQGRPQKRQVDEEKTFLIRTHSLTPADVEILECLTQYTRDYSGQTISSSAIIRALLRFANQQGYQWVLSNICPLVEREFVQGVRWGGKKW